MEHSVDSTEGIASLTEAGSTAVPTRSVLRDPGFRHLWLAATSTSFGSQVAVISMPTVAILAAHASARQVGAMFAIGYVGPPLFGLVAGVVADRHSRKRIMVITALLRVLAIGSVPTAWAFWRISIGQLYLVALVVSISSTFYDIAAQATLPTIVGRTQLADGNAKLALGRSASQISGPSVAGILIQLVGAPATLVADAIAHVLGASSIARLRVTKIATGHRRSLKYDSLDGLRFVWRQKSLRRVAGAAAVLNLGGASIAAIFFVFAYRTLKMTPALVGGVASVGNIGLILGAVGAPRVIGRFGSWRVIRVALASAALSIWLIPVARLGLPWLVLAGYELLFACSSVTFSIAQLSWRQAATPLEYQARTHSIIRSISLSTLPLGALLGGAVGSRFGTTQSIGVGAIIATAGALWFLLRDGATLEAADPTWT
jgi:hypothetical protein